VLLWFREIAIIVKLFMPNPSPTIVGFAEDIITLGNYPTIYASLICLSGHVMGMQEFMGFMAIGLAKVVFV